MIGGQIADYYFLFSLREVITCLGDSYAYETPNLYQSI